MKVYVTGKWPYNPYKSEFELTSELLTSYGFTVISSWKEEPLDLKVDCLIAIMSDPEYEYDESFKKVGMALNAGKKVIIVCPSVSGFECRKNKLFHHSFIVRVNTVNQAISILKNN